MLEATALLEYQNNEGNRVYLSVFGSSDSDFLGIRNLDYKGYLCFRVLH